VELHLFKKFRKLLVEKYFEEFWGRRTKIKKMLFLVRNIDVYSQSESLFEYARLIVYVVCKKKELTATTNPNHCYCLTFENCSWKVLLYFRFSRFVKWAYAAISISIVDLENSPGSGVQPIGLHFGGEKFSWNLIRWRHRAYPTVVQLCCKRSQIKFSSQHFRK